MAARSGDGCALAIVLGADEAQLDDLRAQLRAQVSLAALDIGDWNAELSPWPAPGLRAGQPFAGGAQATYQRLMAALPELRAQAALETDIQPARTLLVGYSLAGLCALWIACQTDAFCGVGSVSGSLWYDGFCSYIATHTISARTAYLSLGNAEPRARNKRLARVGECTLAARDVLARAGCDVRFEWNPGNHFADAPGRMARCIDWLCAHT